MKTDYDTEYLYVVVPNQPLTEDQVTALDEAKEYAKEKGVEIKVFRTK